MSHSSLLSHDLGFTKEVDECGYTGWDLYWQGRKMKLVYRVEEWNRLGYVLDTCNNRVVVQLPRRIKKAHGSRRGSRRMTECKVIIDGIRRLYSRKAKEYLDYRVQHIASVLGLVYTGLKVTYQESRFLAYCTSSGKLAFSSHVMMYPLPVIDYLIVHELAHTVHFHHGKEFWRFLDKCMPNVEYLKQFINRHYWDLRWIFCPKRMRLIFTEEGLRFYVRYDSGKKEVGGFRSGVLAKRYAKITGPYWESVEVWAVNGECQYYQSIGEEVGYVE